MSFLHQKSCECVKTELDLFSLPPTQTSIDSGKWIQYKPVSSITDNAPIEFVIPGHGDEYTDLSQTMIHVMANIKKSDGSDLAAADDNEVGPINNWLHSLFNQVDVYMNNRLVSPQNNTYAYRAYIENTLNYGDDAKLSHIECGLYVMDTHSKMDSISDENEGFKKRKEYTTRSKTVDMLGRLHVDLCNQEKFLLNGVELRFRMIRSRDTFSIMANTDSYKVNIKEVNLFIRRCKISPSVLLAHSKTLESGSAKYPITRVEVKSITLPTGIRNKTLDSVFLGQLPKRLIFGLVSNEAFNGNLKKNPFNFKNYKLNFLALYIDGEQVPFKALEPTFDADNSQFILAYQSLFTGTGIFFTNAGNAIPRSAYAGGYTLYAFDLTADLSASESSHWNLVRNGNLRIELKFSEALTETVNCIVYAEFDNVIEVDRHRNVTADFSG